jgi:hypothetical protein
MDVCVVLYSKDKRKSSQDSQDKEVQKENKRNPAGGMDVCVL